MCDSTSSVCLCEDTKVGERQRQRVSERKRNVQTNNR